MERAFSPSLLSPFVPRASPWADIARALGAQGVAKSSIGSAEGAAHISLGRSPRKFDATSNQGLKARSIYWFGDSSQAAASPMRPSGAHFAKSMRYEAGRRSVKGSGHPIARI
jgi:hypothetical protein